MRRTRFNDGWEVRPKTNRFLEIAGLGSEWSSVTLPHDAMIGTERSSDAGPATGYFRGGIWEYRKTFSLPPADAAATVILEFEGIYRDGVVMVDGAIAGHRPYGYSRFFVPIDHLLNSDTEHSVYVEALARDDSRWYPGAGIYRNVWLLTSGPVHLVPDGIVVRTPDIADDGAVIAVDATVRNRSTSTMTSVIQVEILDAADKPVARAGAPVTIFPGESITVRRQALVTDPQRWGPEHPYLYRCRVTLLSDNETIDEDTTTFGIRSLSVDRQRGLRINGEPILLRGACIHHDNGPIGSATIERAEERRVELLKAAGFNAIRSAHNPISIAMLHACDRLGVLVMDESFDMWMQTKTDDDYALRFADWWERDIEAMVRKDINHPSVIMYSIGNEIPDGSTPTGIQVGRALADKVRSLDDTRFVTQAITGLLVAGPEVYEELREAFEDTEVDEETGINTAAVNLADALNRIARSRLVTEKTEEPFSNLDISGYNYMESRFEMDRDVAANRVIVATETHPTAINTGWAGVMEHSHVIGDFTWTGWDYLGEAGIGRTEYGDPAEGGMGAFHGEYPWLTAWCGDIDITGHRRPQSFYREIVFGLRGEPYIAVQRPEHHGKVIALAGPWSWSNSISSWTWDGNEGAPVTVEVYSGADEVELLVNGTSLGRQPAGPAYEYRAKFEAEYAPGELVAVAFNGGTEIGRTSLHSASGPAVLALRADRAEISADPNDLAYVEITLVDADGNLHTTADRAVTVALEGPGVLQGFASGNPSTDESFVDDTHTTFDGLALAVVRPIGTGTITVTATAEGCDAQQVTVEARG